MKTFCSVFFCDVRLCHECRTDCSRFTEVIKSEIIWLTYFFLHIGEGSLYFILRKMRSQSEKIIIVAYKICQRSHMYTELSCCFTNGIISHIDGHMFPESRYRAIREIPISSCEEDIPWLEEMRDFLYLFSCDESSIGSFQFFSGKPESDFFDDAFFMGYNLFCEHILDREKFKGNILLPIFLCHNIINNTSCFRLHIRLKSQ